MKLISLFLLIIVSAFLSVRAQERTNSLAKTIILKFKPEYRLEYINHGTSLNSFFEAINKLGISRIEQKFKNTNEPKLSDSKELVDLSLIYELRYTAEIPVETTIKQLKSLGFLEYAEPSVVFKPMFSPNDPFSGLNQAYLTTISAKSAWDFTKGDTNVVIGIIDAGFDMSHPDLINNIKYNYADTLDGVDNDNDGYIDNFSGWDFGENDNDPNLTTNNHGTAVAGLADASTNNSRGVAGVGFNCKFMPIKVANVNGDFINVYEAIIYAAEHGCKIINCSFGSLYSSGKYGQDIVNYATFNKDALVIASAGNDGMDNLYYPAAYDNVISVAATDASDIVYSGSTYNYTVDLTAPGVNLYSTLAGTNYNYITGTSYSAALVSGGAALLRSFYPSYKALQIGELLKRTSDNVYSLNPTLQDKLGAGRINLERALTETSSPSVVMSNIVATDNADNIFDNNETVRITANFTNYLAPTTNATVTLTTSSPYVSIITGKISIGTLGTLQTINNNASPFLIKVASNVPENSVVDIKFTVASGTYSSVIHFQVILNQGFIDYDINNVITSITSTGKIGYYKFATEGKGFIYQTKQSILKEAGLMMTDSPSSVSDNIGGLGVPDKDLAMLYPIRFKAGTKNPLRATGSFNDSLAPLPLNVKVNETSMAWSSDSASDFVIVEYKIINENSSSLFNFSAGIYADWNIGDQYHDIAAFDATTNLGYVYSNDGDGYAGIKLLSEGDAHQNAIDAVVGGNGGINIQDGFSTTEKYQSLVNIHPEAGNNGVGSDVMHVVSYGPTTIKAKDTLVLAFAILASDHLINLKKSAVTAQALYNLFKASSVGVMNVTANEFKISCFPNPARSAVTIAFELEETSRVKLEVFNSLGEQVLTLAGQNYDSGKNSIPVSVQNLNNGTYIYRIIINNQITWGKIIVVK